MWKEAPTQLLRGCIRGKEKFVQLTQHGACQNHPALILLSAEPLSKEQVTRDLVAWFCLPLLLCVPCSTRDSLPRAHPLSLFLPEGYSSVLETSGIPLRAQWSTLRMWMATNVILLILLCATPSSCWCLTRRRHRALRIVLCVLCLCISAAVLSSRKEQNQADVFTPEIIRILPRAGRAGDWDTGHLASWWLSCIGMLCWGFHEKTMTFTENNDLCRVSKPW